MIRILIPLGLVLFVATAIHGQELGAFVDFPTPAGPDAREPSLFATEDGRLLMSWTEATGSGFAVKVAILENGGWGVPRTVIASPDLFVNWADFPSVAAFADGTLAAHWLQRSGDGTYSYDAHIAVSRDDGASWSAPLVPHQDGTRTQHGFVTLMPFGDRIVAVWLDARAYDGDLLEAGAISGAMQLRAAVVSSDGTAAGDGAVDFMTCSCCQTAAAVAGDTLLVAYRDRSDAEVRDIAVVAMRDGRWLAPMPVHDDNWEISGCPVNGPSIAARGDRAVVAWFTGADDVPAVKLAFSSDAGRSFGTAVRIDHGSPVGRVDTLMLGDGSTLVSWLEWTGSDERLFVCRATPGGCAETQEVVVNSEVDTINFPQMAATREGIYLAWTQPLADGSDTVRMLRSAR